MRIYYTVDDPDFDDFLYIDTTYKSLEWIAEACAEDYDSNSNWEDTMEAVFRIWDVDKQYLGKCKVYREFMPTFSAFKENE